MDPCELPLPSPGSKSKNGRALNFTSKQKFEKYVIVDGTIVLPPFHPSCKCAKFTCDQVDAWNEWKCPNNHFLTWPGSEGSKSKVKGSGGSKSKGMGSGGSKSKGKGSGGSKSKGKGSGGSKSKSKGNWNKQIERKGNWNKQIQRKRKSCS
jgi:hypothetical protein